MPMAVKAICVVRIDPDIECVDERVYALALDDDRRNEVPCRIVKNILAYNTAMTVVFGNKFFGSDTL